MVRKRLFGDNSNEYAKYLNLKASIFKELVRYEEALELHNQAIIIRKNKKELKKDLAISYNNISMIYSDLGKKELALEFLEKAHEVVKNSINIDYLLLSKIYNNQSILYLNTMKLDLALEYAKYASKIKEKELDNNHDSLAITYDNISLIYQAFKKFNDVLEYSNKSIDIWETIVDKKHPSLAISYNNIAYIYKNLKECQKAKDYMGKAKNIFSLYEYKNKEKCKPIYKRNRT